MPPTASDAELARTLMATARTAPLHHRRGGFPFGSVVAPAVDERGRPLLLLSDLAVHSRNLAGDPRASLMVTEPGDGTRLDLAGHPRRPLAELTGAERERRWRPTRPIIPARWGDRHGFRSTARRDVRAVRRRVARMSWVDRRPTPQPSPIRDAACRRHRRAHERRPRRGDGAVLPILADRPATVAARMTGIDRYGFTMLGHPTSPATGNTSCGWRFDEPVDTRPRPARRWWRWYRKARAKTA